MLYIYYFWKKKLSDKLFLLLVNQLKFTYHKFEGSLKRWYMHILSFNVSNILCIII